MARRVSCPSLVGRSETLAALLHALDRAPTVALLSGDAGIGKTRLASELAERARATGVRVLWGNCVPTEAGELPYAPFITAFRGLVAPAPAGRRDPADARAERFEAVVAALERLAAEAPVLLVVEDVHWADGATQDLLRFLARNVREIPVMLLATLRTDEPGVPAGRRRLVAELARTAERFELEPLGLEDTRRQLRGILGGEPAEATVRTIHARAEGNPYFAEELLAAGEVPAALRSVLLSRVADLDAGARRVLRLVASAGRGIEHERLVRVEAVDEAALRKLVDRHVLTHSHGRYAFRHALAREAIYGELLPAERRELHAALASVFQDDPAALAHHLAEADRPAAALRASMAAADAAAAVYAFAAVRHELARARELWPRVAADERPSGVDEVGLLRRLAEATRLAGQWDAALPIAEEALRLARGDPREAALHLAVADVHHTPERALPHLDRALELLGPTPSRERAAVLLSIASHQSYGTRPSVEIERVSEAFAVAVEAEALPEQTRAHLLLGSALAYGGEEQAGLEHLREACRLAIGLGRGADLGYAVGLLTDALAMLGRVEEGLAAAEDGLQQIERLGVALSYGRSVESDAVDCELRLGRWDAAAERLDRLRARPIDEEHVRLVVLGYELALDARRGRFPAAQNTERAVLSLLDANVGGHCVVKANSTRAELALLRGDAEAALDIVLSTWHRVGTADLSCGPALMALGMQAAADVGDRITAGRLHGGPGSPGSLHWYCFELRGGESAPPETLANRALGDAELARLDGHPRPELWASAAAGFDAVKSPYQAAYARWREAEARLALRDRARAEAPLRSAHAAAAGLGAAPLCARLEALARRSGTKLTAPAGRAFGLTGRELTVLRLLAVGRTNRAIAAELYLSPRTVDMHVRNILGKLGATNRVQAAAAAHRAGITAEPP